MPRFAANLGFLFTEHPFLDRFAAAQAAGFQAVEFAAPYLHPARDIAARLADNGLECELFNLPLGEAAGGPAAGIACRPEHVAQFREGVALALEYAEALGTRRMNCIAGVAAESDDAHACERTLVENLRFAAGELARTGRELVIEPINTHDAPGFFVATAAHGASLVREVDAPNFGLQCDLYHTKMMGDDPAATLARLIGVIRHIQFADAPGRHEPGTGTMDFAQLFDDIDRMGYEGWVAAEYRPSKPTHETLHWFR
ncbi:MAG: TIM barrel protein [Usitatibacter sp.]